MVERSEPDQVDVIRGCVERTHINDMIVGTHYIQDMNVVLRAYDNGVDEHNETSDEFNAGYEAAQAGKSLDDEPENIIHDEWRIGYVWGKHCLEEEEENGRKKLEELDESEKEEVSNDD